MNGPPYPSDPSDDRPSESDLALDDWDGRFLYDLDDNDDPWEDSTYWKRTLGIKCLVCGVLLPEQGDYPFCSSEHERQFDRREG